LKNSAFISARCFLINFLLLYCGTVCSQSNKDLPWSDSVSSKIASFIEKWNIPGASAAIVKDGKLIYCQSFGYADIYKKTTHQTLFRIASLSKPITAIAIMKLVQDGGLRLDQKVFGKEGIFDEEEYGRVNDRRVFDITIRHLLQHTSGWDLSKDPMFDPVEIADIMHVASPADAGTIIRYELMKPLKHTPGSTFDYSNFGYCVLGRVIEKLSGQRYCDFVRDSILLPAGIKDMVLAKNMYHDKAPDETQYYDGPYNKPLQFYAASWHGDPSWSPQACGGFNIESMDAHGGWLATAKDLAKLLSVINGHGEKALLRRDFIDTMMATCPANQSYGLGWNLSKEGNAWHTGSIPGASCIMARLKNGFDCILLFNKRVQAKEYAEEMDRLIWKILPEINVLPASYDLFPRLMNDDPGNEEKNEESVVTALHYEHQDMTLFLQLEEETDLKASIVNGWGKEVAILAQGRLMKGRYEFFYEHLEEVNGIYFCRILTEKKVILKKLIF
jgi:CubicO group peptidase (beta-lactamase class C family)